MVIPTIVGGLFVGAAHAFAGPDHIAAVVPLSWTDSRKGARTGFAWGAGHGAGVAVLTLLAVALREMLHVELISAWSEVLVGALLIGIGAWTLMSHRHAHAARPAASTSGPAASTSGAATGHPGAAFGVGAIHGSAGMGHLVGMLPALGMSLQGAIAYLIAFILGAWGAMIAVGWSVGTMSAHAGERWRTRLVIGSALGAIVIGWAWLVRSVVAMA